MTQSIAELRINCMPDPDRPYVAELIDLESDRTFAAAFNLNLKKLETLFERDNPEAYGQYLFDQVFRKSVDPESGREGELANFLQELVRQAENQEQDGLRLQIEIFRYLKELTALGWEYLFDGEDTQGSLALAADLRFAFFRDVSVRTARREALDVRPSVLVAVICPDEENLNQFNTQHQLNLKAVDKELESERLNIFFERLRPNLFYQVLPVKATTPQAAFDRIADAMTDGQFNILHLLCHGGVINNKAFLIFEDEDGRVDLVPEEKFADLFADMKGHVRLVVLDACQTAQQSNREGFSGMVQKLVEKVPAAVGMQRTWYTGVAGNKFTHSFYTELARDGRVDRALQRARRDLRRWKPGAWEWGTPVLYLRLGEGQLFRPERAATGRGAQPKGIPGGREGGTGLKITGSAQAKGLVLENVSAAGGDIVEGGSGQGAPGGAAGVGIEVGDEASLEDVRISGGEFAGGSIFKKGLAIQQAEDFGTAEKEKALQRQIAFYESEKARLSAEIAKAAGAELTHLQAELADIEAEIKALAEDS